MFVPFESISPSSRVWIYQTDRKFTDQETAFVSSYLLSFTESWAAHGQALKTSFHIHNNWFIVLAADEGYNSTSGCSVDESVRAIKHIQQELGVELFNRNLVAFKKGEAITLVSLKDLKEKYEDGTWNEDTLTFNNLISVKSQMEAEWIVSAKNTWLKRYIPSLKVAR
jgi:hypothetical protein